MGGSVYDFSVLAPVGFVSIGAMLVLLLEGALSRRTANAPEGGLGGEQAPQPAADSKIGIALAGVATLALVLAIYTAAELFATTTDVMRFAEEMLAADRGNSEVFTQETAQEFFRRQELAEDSDWALGWDTPTAGGSSSGQHFSEHSIGHLGFTGTSLWIDLEREVVVVLLTNRVHLVAKRSRFELRPKVHDLIIEAFREG